ncbi:Na+/H+ antiporter subunit D [Actinomadura parmotrematis]|uniref:Na+/H+ antiporter subunit D n=1 Tax=Actinomadura parmotrematis TaxID=2864039 RepID=A0ABS7FKV3_9ACTN|nr:Na+/H+ antiporter subunit D [Actinomadura parmotrematis]MBW8480989.1 Na+/H+ antiporter subunit D [Actinomadura parmotrematis]
MNHLLPLPVLLPMAAAGVKIVLGPRRPGLQRAISLGVLAAVLGVAVALLAAADRDGPQLDQLGGWAPPIGITLVADRLSAVMLTVSAAVILCVMVYAIAQDVADQAPGTPLSVFHPSYLLLVAGVNDSYLAGDLFNLFVGFEIMLMASYVMITLGGTPARIRSGTTYIIVALLSSMLFLVAIAVVYGATGTVNMAQLAGRLAALPPGVAHLAELMLLTVFGVKAAAFPLSMWLPDSYPTAPAPVTAVFAGLLTKIGVYGVIRTETLLFPGGQTRALLMAVALASMVVGILGAMVQVDIKRLLSFTLVSHIGYMIFGVALDSAAALAATVFYVLHHITIQTTLFLVTGLIERRGGGTSLDRLGGLARTAPLVGLLFFVPAMNLGGIPPMSGFVGKLGLLQAGLADGGPLAYVLVGGAVVTSLLTLYALVKVWNQAFWRAPCTPAGTAADGGGRHGEERAARPGGDGDEEDPPAAVTASLPPAMVGATVAMVALSLAYTVGGGPLIALADRTAAELLRPAGYVRAVAAHAPGGF